MNRAGATACPGQKTRRVVRNLIHGAMRGAAAKRSGRSEEHTSELQSQSNLVCRLLLEKKKMSESSFDTRANVATCYPDATADHVTIVNGGSEADLLLLWTLLEPEDRPHFMIPNVLHV